MNDYKEHPIIFKGWSIRANMNCKPNVWPAEPIDPALPFKWQTRRVIKNLSPHWIQGKRPKPWGADEWSFFDMADPNGTIGTMFRCPYGQPADRLWVKETWAPHPQHPRCRVAYRADMMTYGLNGGWASPSPEAPEHGLCNPTKMLAPKPFGGKWTPSIHMFRWACRELPEVKRVRVERVQSISEEDAIAEGVEKCPFPDGAPSATPGGCSCRLQEPERPMACSFADLWDSINAKRGFGWGVNPWVFVVDYMRKVQP